MPAHSTSRTPRVPRILVIRGGAIGDFILTLPAIDLVREGFPDAHLEILGYSHIVRLAERSGYADAIRSIEYGPMASFFARNGSLPDDLCEYFAGFQQVISYLFDPDRIFAGNLERAGVRHFLHASPRISDEEHAAFQLAKPLQQLALFLENPAPTLRFPDELYAEATRSTGTFPGSYVALHPGSGSERKNWPVEAWRHLIESLLEGNRYFSILLVGGEADRARIASLQMIAPPPRLQTLTDLPLHLLAAVIAKARWFVGHDSGISHMAAATGIPCTLLFGPTDPEVWAPKNRNATVLQPDGRDLATLPVESVLATQPPNEIPGGRS